MANKAKPTPAAGDSDNLAAWLTSPECKAYFGRAWALKADVLAALINGESLAAVAVEHQVSDAACYKYARRAKAIFIKTPKSWKG